MKIEYGGLHDDFKSLSTAVVIIVTITNFVRDGLKNCLSLSDSLIYWHVFLPFHLYIDFSGTGRKEGKRWVHIFSKHFGRDITSS